MEYGIRDLTELEIDFVSGGGIAQVIPGAGIGGTVGATLTLLGAVVLGVTGAALASPIAVGFVAGALIGAVVGALI